MKPRLIKAALFWLCLAGIGVILLLRPKDTGLGLPCIIYSLTGLYCPGCGSSRSLASLLHVEFYQAFRWNPLLFILFPFAAFYLLWGSVSYVRLGQNTLDDRIPKWVLWCLVAIVILYFPLRNLPLWPFSLLRPTAV